MGVVINAKLWRGNTLFTLKLRLLSQEFQRQICLNARSRQEETWRLTSLKYRQHMTWAFTNCSLQLTFISEDSVTSYYLGLLRPCFSDLFSWGRNHQCSQVTDKYVGWWASWLQFCSSSLHTVNEHCTSVSWTVKWEQQINKRNEKYSKPKCVVLGLLRPQGYSQTEKYAALL